MRSQPAQSIRSSNPFSSDDDVSDDDDKQQDYIQTTKPYEEHFEKFNQQFNNYIQKTKELDQKYQMPLGDTPFNLLHLNVNQQVQKQGLFDVNQTDNVFYDKVSATFTYLDTEIGKIIEVFENKILNVISMYGERALDDFQDEEEFPLLEGQAEFEMSKLSPIFKQSLDLIKKIMGILYNLINQINIIYYKKNDLHKNVFKNVEMNSVFQTIGKGLSVVYVLDCAINQNKKIRDHWNVYKRMIKIIQTDPQKFGSDSKTVKRFEKNIARLDKTVLSGACVQAVLEQNYDANKHFTSDQLKQQNLCLLTKNKDLIELFENYFKQQIVFYNDILDTTSEVQERKDLLYFLCTYAFFRKVFPEEQDKKIYKSLWTLQKKSPVLEGHTHIFCYVYKFLRYVCPLSKSTTLDPKEPEIFTKLYVQDLDIQIPKKINAFYEDFCYWVSRMESILTSNTALATGEKSKRDRSIKIVEEYTSYRVRLLIKALQMSSQIKQMITTNLMLHINEGIGFTPQLIKFVVKGIVMLKAIESVYISKIEAFQPHMLLKSLIKQLLAILGVTYEKLTKADYKQKKPVFNEFRAAIQNVIKNLRGPITSLKISTMEFALNFITSNFVTEKKEGQDIKFIFWKIKTISQFQYNISKATNCSFLFWCKDILPLAIKQFFENPSQSKRLIYLSQAISDTVPIVKATLHLQNPLYMYETFKDEVITTFKDEYLVPLTRQIEDFLRIQIHAMLIDKVVGKNPFKDEITNIKKLLELEQIQFFDVIIDIKKEIQNQLNEKFYNLNVLNMHDMETYEQMRVLAKFYFDVNLINVYIPSQTIEQGQLDILQILRNIPTFVDTYTYNLHNQTFTQITTESKLVQTIGIQQISDSIRTHGLGILNTTVNSIFKYIAKKIEILSNLLYDEIILQNLIREEKWFQENKVDIDGYYPYERAKKLSSNLKKLGVSKEGNTYLDQFRIIITQIGNSLGFIRLLRSASLNYCSKSIEFLPYQMDSEESFIELAKQAMSGQATIKAAKELDDILLQLKSYFSSGTDYLKRIVSTMSKYAQSDSQKHFTNFHLLVPCLTLNYVTHVLVSKEKIPLKNNQNGFLCNDGFIIGIAYILKLYNLEEKFHLIHWQEEVRKVYKEELEQIKVISQANTTQISTHRLQEMTLQNDLSIKKLESNLFEYNMFFNTFQACKILFREDPV